MSILNKHIALSILSELGKSAPIVPLPSYPSHPATWSTDPIFQPSFVRKSNLSDRPPAADRNLGEASIPAQTAGAIGPHFNFGPKRSPISKYKRFVPVAEAFRDMSKMPGTKVGCIILGDSFQVLASGWNGAPRGCNADEDDRLVKRESRLCWTVHAESNAVANAALSGVKLEGGVAITTYMPCMACAKLLAQAGISKVLCPEPTPADARWQSEFDLAKELFFECDIDLHYYDTFGEKE